MRITLQHHARNAFVALDARKEEIYQGLYQLDSSSQIMQPVITDRVISPAAAVDVDKTYQFFGIGVKNYHKQLAHRYHRNVWENDQLLYPQAKHLLSIVEKLGALEQIELGQAHEALPVYIRDDIAQPR